VGYVKEKERAESLATNVTRLESSLAKSTKENEALNNQIKSANEQVSSLKEKSHKLAANAQVLTERLENSNRTKRLIG